MSKKKSKLIDIFPYLYKKELKELFEKNVYYKDRVTLQEFIYYLSYKRIFQYCMKNFSKFNYSIEKIIEALWDLNLIKEPWVKDFINIVIFYYPTSSLYFPDEVYNEETITYIKKYIEKHPKKINSSTIFAEIPPSLAKIPIIKSKLLEKLETEKEEIPATEALTYLKNYIDDSSYIEQLLKIMKVKYSFVDEISNFSELLSNEKIITFLLNEDYLNFILIPQNKTEFASKIIAEKIRNGSIPYKEIEKNQYIEKIGNNKETLNAVIDTYGIQNSHRFIMFSSIELLDEKQIIEILEHNTTGNRLYLPDDYVKSPIALSIFLKIKPSYVKNFHAEAFNKENIDYIFSNFSEEKIYNIMTLQHLISDENVINLMLKCLNDGILNKKIDSKLFINYLPKCSHALSSKNIDVNILSNLINYSFRNEDFIFFKEKVLQSNNINIIEPLINIKSLEEFKKIFLFLQENYDKTLVMIVIKKYKKSGLNDQHLNQLCQYHTEIIKNRLRSQFKDKAAADLLIDKIANDKRNAFTLEYVQTEPHLKVAANYIDILSTLESFEISYIHEYISDNVNKKQLKNIIELIINQLNIDTFKAYNLAIRIYGSIGYERSKELLNPIKGKNYGPINYKKLEKIFSTISLNDISFKGQGTGLTTKENQKLNSLLFGNNYKDKNSLMHQYLTDYEDLKHEYETKKTNINNETHLTIRVRDEKIKHLEEELNQRIKEMTDFIENFAWSFNNWELLEEEYYGNSSVSKLSIKLNTEFINNTRKKIKSSSEKIIFDIEDEQLKNSRVFDYVGIDNQYVSNIYTVKRRAQILSRRMNKISTKKFPNISIRQNGYKLFVYNPQDRNILCAGHRSECCFRPNGTADDAGNDNSLLNYCVSTEYGGGIEIVDQQGETIMFSPILRNGNVLMIHSIETKYNNNYKKMETIHKLLVEYAKKTIEVAKKNGDQLDFVAITDLHHLNCNYTNGNIPSDKKFVIYDPEYKFRYMYNNLDNNHCILAFSEDKTVEDIDYKSIPKSYEYPVYESTFSFQFRNEELIILKQMIEIKNNIIKLSNRNPGIMHIGKLLDEPGHQLLLEIKKNKQKYLELYKKIISMRKGVNLFEQYKKSINLIRNINKQLNIDINTGMDIADIYCGINWYIVVTQDNKLVANALPTGIEEMKRTLDKIKSLRQDLRQDNQDFDKKEPNLKF